LPPLTQFLSEVGKERPVYRTEPMDLDLAVAAERDTGTLVQVLPQ
jgi:hypothetical protein